MNSEEAAQTALCPRRAARRPGGFTVLELVVALGVVAVLATLALNAWSGWRARVDVKRAVDDITAISTVVDQYFQDTQAYPASLDAIGRGGLRDPWGNAYQYLNLAATPGNGQARKDHSLVPLNSDYDLYSAGKDGRSAPPLTSSLSRDDIVRANNGRFVGPASTY